MIPFTEALGRDLAFSFRMIRRSPGFTAAVVLTLALGIGATTAIFTVINGVLLRPLPYPEPDRLVYIAVSLRGEAFSPFAYTRDFAAWRKYNRTLTRIAAYMGFHANLTGTDDAEWASCGLATESLFPLLGVQPVLGRNFLPEEDLPGAPPVAILEDAFWKRRFGGDRAVIGRAVVLDDQSYTIVGVLPPRFQIPERYGGGDFHYDLWVPFAIGDSGKAREILLHAVGRLKPGVSIETARAELDSLMRAQLRRPDKRAITVVSWHEQVASGAKRSLIVFLAAVACVLLIACVNVANLLLARASGRSKEIAVRMAIGARPLRLVRQLLTESVLLALCGGLLGVLLAQWGATLLVRTSFGAGTVRAFDIHPDAHMLAFTAGVCLLAGILFGLAPALRALGIPVSSTLKEGARGGTATGSAKWSTGKVLVAAQVTLSLLVLFAAGLLVRTLRNLQDVDFGYEREHLVIIRPDFISAGYKHEQLPAVSQRLLGPLNAIPGVVGATVSENGLFSGTEGADDIKIEGYTPASDGDTVSYSDWVGPDYFKVVGVPILLGRGIGPQDVESATKVAVINEAMAKFYFHGVNPIGRKFVIDDGAQRLRPIEIVGISKDVRDHSLREAIPRRFYLAYYQSILPDLEVHFVLRVAGDPTSVLAAVRQQLKDFDPNVMVREADTLNHMVDDYIAQERLVAQLSSLFAGLALLLACVGLYGVMSYTVSGRTREIGVRMALGAQRRDVLWMVLREALLLVGVGVVVGIPAAFGTSRLLQNMLYALSGVDPLSMSVAVAMLLLVAAIAGYIPARRATRVDPMVALRYE